MKLAIPSLEALLETALSNICPALQWVVLWNGQEIVSYAGGWLDPESQQQPVDAQTRFDLASISKLFVTTAFMQLVESGQVALDQPVADILPNFQGLRPIQPYEAPLEPGGYVTVSDQPGPVDAGRVTFRQLLTHTSGLPAWRPLFQQTTAQAARRMAVETFFSYTSGERVLYSDIGLILLGIAIEQITHQPLDQVIKERITVPLSLRNTSYLPVRSQHFDKLSDQSLVTNHQSPISNHHALYTNVAPTEQCAWRQRRVCGEVHDENAWRLGGVSGHAGLFSTAEEVARFGESFLNHTSLLQPATIEQMTQLQAQHGDVRRGLGFALWSPDPEASSNPLSQRAFGHLGFTGTMLWIDPTRQLVIALLTNDLYYGRTGRGIQPLRVAFNRQIVEWIEHV